MAWKITIFLLCFHPGWALSAIESRETNVLATPVLYVRYSDASSNPQQVKFNVAAQEPSYSSSLPVINPSFPGFACEERSFLDYAGRNNRPNVFSQNLVNEVAKRTGTNPSIRVGGTSLDHSNYKPSQKKAAIIPPDQMGLNVPMNVTYGPSFFDTFATFPNAKYIFDVPLATNNLSNTVEFAKTGYSRIGASNIEQFEVGNEPDVYTGEDRPQNYTPRDYVREWAQYTGTISKALGVPRNKPMYQAIGLYGSSSVVPVEPLGPKWNVQHLFRDGLDRVLNRISSVSLHYYQTISSDSSNLQRDLMNHTAIAIKLGYYETDVRFLASKGLPTNLGEVGSSYNVGTNNFALESVLGSCLWQLDFMLYAMSIGVNRVNMQLGIGFGFALWQPVEFNGLPAAVAPPYYAHIVAADFIGTDGPVSVSNIDLDSDVLSAYAAYDRATGALMRAMVVNLELWSSFYSDYPRPNSSLAVPVPSYAKNVVVQYLSSPLGATASNSLNITWAGVSWSYQSKGLGVPSIFLPNDTKILHPSDGMVNVQVNASQAAMLFFN